MSTNAHVERFKERYRWEMDFANRGNKQQPAHNNQGQANAPQGGGQGFSFSGNQGGAPAKKMRGGLDFGKVGGVAILILASLLVLGVIVIMALGGGKGASESSLIDTDRYQAVFLDSADGQVYFGKLSVHNRNLYQLTDIYYVRVEQALQPDTNSGQQSQANISLAKLGNELHGPEDVMFISRDKVLFWENLKDDGQVVQAITEYVENGGESTQDNSNQQQINNQQNTNDDSAQQQADSEDDNAGSDGDTNNDDANN